MALAFFFSEVDCSVFINCILAGCKLKRRLVMKYIRVKCRGIEDSSVLMDPMSQEMKIAILRKTPAPVVRDKPLEQMAAEKIYRDKDGTIGLPAAMLRKCLVMAGTKVPLRGRTNVSRADGSTELFSFLWIVDKFLVFSNIPKLEKDGEEEKKYWQVSVVAGKQNQNGKGKGGATVIVRPEFQEWEFTVTIRYDETRVNEEVIKKLFTEGGLTQGLAAWRPNCGGDHGQFKYVEWVDVTAEMVAAPAKEKAVAA